MGSKVGLVCGTQLSKHGLPIIVFATRRRVVLPAVVPLTRLPHFNHFCTLTILQCNPSWPVHEAFAVQSSLSQLANSPLIGVLCQFGQHLICHSDGVFQQSCAERLPTTPSTLRVISASLSASKVHRTSLATWPTCGPTPSDYRPPSSQEIIHR